MAGKGDKRRWDDLPKEYTDLRWELAFGCKDSPLRKEEVKARIKEIEESGVIKYRRCHGTR
jgi:DNA-binding Lrp family transcriptional regulator